MSKTTYQLLICLLKVGGHQNASDSGKLIVNSFHPSDRVPASQAPVKTLPVRNCEEEEVSWQFWYHFLAAAPGGLRQSPGSSVRLT